MIAFTEMKHFYVYKIDITEATSPDEELCDTIDLEMEEEVLSAKVK